MAHDIEKDWITRAGFRAVVLVCKNGNRRTHRCGYVGIPQNHPLHGVEYSDQADCLTQDMADNSTLGSKSPILILTAAVRSDGEGKVRRSPDVVFDVHGGLTYSGSSDGYPVEADGLFWYGFDCRHHGDGEIDPDPSWGYDHGAPVRELDYVERECERLAAQLAQLMPQPALAN